MVKCISSGGSVEIPFLRDAAKSQGTDGAGPSPSAAALQERGRGDETSSLASSGPLLRQEPFSKSATFQQTLGLKHPSHLPAQSFAQLQPLRLCFKA